SKFRVRPCLSIMDPTFARGAYPDLRELLIRHYKAGEQRRFFRRERGVFAQRGQRHENVAQPPASFLPSRHFLECNSSAAAAGKAGARFVESCSATFPAGRIPQSCGRAVPDPEYRSTAEDAAALAHKGDWELAGVSRTRPG